MARTSHLSIGYILLAYLQGGCYPPNRRDDAAEVDSYRFGGSALMLPSAEWGSWEMARSPMETTPTGLLPSTTGRRRMAFSRIRRTASSMLSVSDTVVSSWLQMSASVVAERSRPAATARTTMSRSVTMPQICAFSTTM